MKRRSFLKWIGKGAAAVAAAPAVAKVPAAEAADTIQNQLLDNHQLATHSRGIVTAGEHSKMLWPGVNKLYSKMYDDLPGAAKVACDRYVDQGLMTEDEYVKGYFGE